MNYSIKLKQLLTGAFLLSIGFTSIAWQKGNGNMPEKKAQAIADTTKPNNKKSLKEVYRAEEFEQIMQDLNTAMLQLNKQMKEIDYAVIEKNIAAAKKQIDTKKIEAEINKAITSVDWKKIQIEVNAAMAKAEIQSKIAFDAEKLSKQMEELSIKMKEQQLALHLDGKKLSKTIEKSMKHAKEGIKKAKQQIEKMQQFVDVLAKDGLIDKQKGYVIKLTEDGLYINGTKQSSEVYERYKKYYPKEKFTISNDGANTANL